MHSIFLGIVSTAFDRCPETIQMWVVVDFGISHSSISIY